MAVFLPSQVASMPKTALVENELLPAPVFAQMRLQERQHQREPRKTDEPYVEQVVPLYGHDMYGGVGGGGDY